MKKLFFKLFSCFIFLVILTAIFSQKTVSAATRTWDGGGGADTNWSTCANWDGPDICPVAGDTATFNATSTNNSTIDSGFGGSIGVVNLNSGYTGTVTQAETLAITSTFTVSAGTFNASSQTLTVTSTTTVSGGILNLNSSSATLAALTFSSGTLTMSSGTTNISGNLTFSGSGTFSANGGALNITGVGGTLSCNNVTFNLVSLSTITSTETVNSNCSLPMGNNPNVSRGITLNGTLSGSGRLTTSTAGTGVFTLNSGAALSGFSELNALLLTINGATLDLSNYTFVNVTSTFTLSSGSFSAPTGIMTTGGVAHSGGTFINNGGTIRFIASVIISGSTTFYNLIWVVTSSGSPTLTFTAGTTQIIQGTLTLKGLAGTRLLLRSSSSGTPWNIDAQGGRVLNSLDVKDSNNINSSPMLADANSINSGNNTNWSFGTSNISFYLDYPGGNSHISNTNPTYRWKKATVTNNSAITKYELFVQPKDIVTNTNIGTRLYIDNILPNIGDNKQYFYYTTYTLHDDGDFLNLVPSDYILMPGKYNFRVVAHDSAGNIREESLDFFVDTSPTTKPKTNFVSFVGNQNQNTQPPQQTTTDTNTPTPQPTPHPDVTDMKTPTEFNWWWILVLLIILFLLFLLWKRRKKVKE